MFINFANNTLYVEQIMGDTDIREIVNGGNCSN